MRRTSMKHSFIPLLEYTAFLLRLLGLLLILIS
jgi:hypothetical protein